MARAITTQFFQPQADRVHANMKQLNLKNCAPGGKKVLQGKQNLVEDPPSVMFYCYTIH